MLSSPATGRATLTTLVLLGSLFLCLPVFSQVTTGTPPFSSLAGGPDVINFGNLNAHITIPVLHKPGRGLNFTYDISYDTSVWYPVFSNGVTSWQPVGNWGWSGTTQALTGSMSQTTTDQTCQVCNQYTCWYPTGQYDISNWVYKDQWGVPHSFTGTVIINNGVCPNYGGPNSTGFTSTTSDGSGITLAITGSSNTTGITVVLTTAGGTILNGPISSGSGNTDRNGNQISVNSSGAFTDTLNTTALTVSGTGTPTSPTLFTYSAPGPNGTGVNAAYSMKFATYSMRTNFGCSGITDYGTNGTTTANLVSEIDLPDYNSTSNPNSRYTFTYESTPGHSGFVTGRLASLTLPTGGTITYQYTGGSSGNITCADGSTPGLKRYTPDTVSNYWEYDRTLGTGAAYTLTISDPQSNKTVVQFQGLYETQRDFYQGSVSSANLLQTTKTCYNGNATNCTSTAVALPISQRKIITVLPGGLQSEHDDLWNPYGAPIESDDYDYGTTSHGALLKQTIATYTAMGNINAFAQTVTIKDGSGNTVSKIKNNYDETAVIATTGTPQHANPTTLRGNLTSTNSYVNATTFLTKSTTYYDTGNMSTSTDVNGGLTTYSYQSGLPSCYITPSTKYVTFINGLRTVRGVRENSSSPTWA
jgi:hypothetical protein